MIKNKSAVTLIELMVGVTISMLLMVSIGIFVSSALSNLFLQEKSIGNMLSINDFFRKTKNTLDNIDGEEEILTNGILFKRKTEYNNGGYSFIGTKEIDNFYCENIKTKHIFIKNFIPFFDGNNFVNEFKLGNIISNQKENQVLQNGNILVGKKVYGKDFENGELGENVPLNGPTGLAKNGNKLYISDTLNNRILLKKDNGEVSVILGSESGLSQPTGLSLVGDNLFIANSGKGEILKYFKDEETPEYLQKFEFSKNYFPQFEKVKITYVKKFSKDYNKNNFTLDKENIRQYFESKGFNITFDDINYYETSYKNGSGDKEFKELKESELAGKNEIEKLNMKKYFYISKKESSFFEYLKNGEITAPPLKNKIDQIEAKLIDKNIFIEDDNGEIKNIYKKLEIKNGTDLKENIFYSQEKDSNGNFIENFFLKTFKKITVMSGGSEQKQEIEKYFKIKNFKVKDLEFNFPEFKNYGIGKFFIILQLINDQNNSIYLDNKKIFSNDEKGLKIERTGLKYPNFPLGGDNFSEFNNYNKIDFDQEYDEILELPIKSLEITKNGDLLNIILKYYRNFNCLNIDSNEEKINTLILKKKIN